MKPTIAIGDVHGLTYWKGIVEQNPNCRYVFLGDYADPYEAIRPISVLDNLKEIIALKRQMPDDVILLWGNHDLHYVTPMIARGSRFDCGIKPEMATMLNENSDLFQNAFQDGLYVFTHAGISYRWFMYDFGGDAEGDIAWQLNNPTPQQMSALYRCGQRRGGDSPTGGIFWADIDELTDPLPGYIQIVGHSRVSQIRRHSREGGEIVFCDSLFNRNYHKIEE